MKSVMMVWAWIKDTARTYTVSPWASTWYVSIWDVIRLLLCGGPHHRNHREHTTFPDDWNGAARLAPTRARLWRACPSLIRHDASTAERTPADLHMILGGVVRALYRTVPRTASRQTLAVRTVVDDHTDSFGSSREGASCTTSSTRLSAHASHHTRKP